MANFFKEPPCILPPHSRPLAIAADGRMRTNERTHQQTQDGSQYLIAELIKVLIVYLHGNQAETAVMLLWLSLCIVQLASSQFTCDLADSEDQVNRCEDSEKVLSQLAKVNSRLVTAVSQLQSENAQLIAANSELQTSVSQLMKNISQLDRDINQRNDLTHQEIPKGELTEIYSTVALVYSPFLYHCAWGGITFRKRTGAALQPCVS